MEIVQIEGTFRLLDSPTEGYRPFLVLENGATLDLRQWMCGTFCTSMVEYCDTRTKIDGDEVHEASGKLKITVELV